MSNMTNGLQKNLKTRHISMISIAGVIGAGLFVGSGAVIHSAGPGAILSYSFAGLLVIFIMRMLGEMACAYPTSGSFSQYASDAIGPWAGFTIGWLYWFFWVIVIAIEAIAAGRHYSVLVWRCTCLAHKSYPHYPLNINEYLFC